MTILYYPAHIQIVEKKVDGWFYSPGEIIVNNENKQVNLLNIEERHGLTKKQIIIELFRRYSGRLGYYLINLAKREYYYCGQTKQDVKEKLWDLDIGRRDPME
ncbi:conserved hypothetical protein [Hyella patelloides LEGE 07179]|uniref:Uncharacterized protein n=1 Tax=Hyella patelloides LEGE 07179 TaxID=945734 RepID=A0A563VY88_9CYAN|nr:hypothetical protein [Hyella patelloides]VEP16380.1 conserved hypothetical protein [Hyella patelloides LEGE 07179]